MAKLMLVVPDLDCGGAQRVMLTLTANLARTHHEIFFVIIRGGGPLTGELPEQVSSITLLPRWTPRFLLPPLALLCMLIKLRKQKPAAILTSITGANLVTAVARKLACPRARLVMRHENTAPNLKGRLRTFLVSCLYPTANKIITVSEAAAADLVNISKIPQPLIEIIPNPVDPEKLNADAGANTGNVWLDLPDLPVILSIGRLVPTKDFGTLINAFYRLTRHRDLRLVILGEGPQRKLLEADVRELGLDKQVSMPGVVANPYPWIRACSLFVLSSRWEGLPVALLEAMALGANIVSTDCRSGPRELLDGGRYGRLVPVGDPVRLANAMQEALATPYNPAPVIQRARDFAPNKVAEAHLAHLLT
ncbi:MAG TPA: glycosyltransferase [Gammaproteobacteria bacterium]